MHIHSVLCCHLSDVCKSGYNWFRQWCGMKKAKTFDDLVELPAKVIDQFRQIYASVLHCILFMFLDCRPYVLFTFAGNFCDVRYIFCHFLCCLIFFTCI